MPGINLPPDKGSLVLNTETRFLSGEPDPVWTNLKPSDDSAKLPRAGTPTSKPEADRRGAAAGTNAGPETPLEFVSLATKTVNAPKFGTNLPSDVHKDGWLDRERPAYEDGSSTR